MVLLLQCCAQQGAHDIAAAKSGFHVLAPTPRELLREMQTDRPDTTESPYTVDAGHVQVEMDFVSAERDQGSTETLVGNMNLKLGLTSFADLQVLAAPYDDADGVTGIGDTTLRIKVNAWGDDGGATAIGLMPFLTLPTAKDGLGSGHVETGLILPFAVQAPLDLDLATMIELDYAHHDDHYGLDLIVTGSIGHEIWGPLGGYVELASTTPLDATSDSELGMNGGLILELGDDWEIDGGARVGLNDPAPDLALFAGGAARF
jgi:hypothetical protein